MSYGRCGRAGLIRAAEAKEPTHQPLADSNFSLSPLMKYTMSKRCACAPLANVNGGDMECKHCHEGPEKLTVCTIMIDL